MTIISITISIVTVIGLTDIKKLTANTLMYIGLAVPFILMIYQYSAIRKRKVFIAWTIIALVMFVEFFWLKRYHILLPSGYNSANLFRAPLCLLLLFIFFRKLANEYFYTELIIPVRYTDYNNDEQRYANAMDLISSFSYWIAIILIGVY